MRIIGLDLGSSSVKAVEIDSAFGRYEIRDYYEHTLQAGQDPVQGAAQLLSSLPKSSAKIAISLPSTLVTQRNMTIPSRDRKAVKAAVMFELEDDLPFEVDEAAFDYSVLSQGSQGSHVHIAASIRQQAIEYVASLNAVGIDPDLISTESWAFRTYLKRVLNPATQDVPVLLVQLGANNTTYYGHWNNAPLFIHEGNWGGNDLTAAIATEYRMSPSDAERAKKDRGLQAPGSVSMGNSDALECRGEILNTLQTLVLEIKQAMLSCRSLTNQNPAQILFCGGDSLVPGLLTLLGPELHTPIQPVQALSALSLSGASYSEQSDATFLLAASLALCMVGQDRSAAINFRKGALAKPGGMSAINMKVLKRPMIGTGIVLSSLAISLGTESYLYQKKLQEENLALEKSMRAFMPTLSESAAKTYINSPSRLKDLINKELSTQRERAALYGANTHSPLNMLKNLSQQIPKSVVVDMTRFQVGAAADASYKPNNPTDANLTFLVSSPQMVDKLTELMPRILESPKKIGPEDATAPDGSGKKLKVTFTGKPREDAYAR